MMVVASLLAASNKHIEDKSWRLIGTTNVEKVFFKIPRPPPKPTDHSATLMRLSKLISGKEKEKTQRARDF